MPIISGSGGGGGGGTQGTELMYAQITAGVNIASTSSAAPTSIIAGTAVTYDGLPVLVMLFSPATLFSNATTNDTLTIGVIEAGAYIGTATNKVDQTANQDIRTIVHVFRFTPSAGSHTYGFGAHVSSTTGTPAVQAGTGVGTAVAPAFIRITKV